MSRYYVRLELTEAQMRALDREAFNWAACAEMDGDPVLAQACGACRRQADTATPSEPKDGAP